MEKDATHYDPTIKRKHTAKLVDWLMEQQWFRERLDKHLTILFGKQNNAVEEGELEFTIEAIIFEDLINSQTPLEYAATSSFFSNEEQVVYHSWIDQSIFAFFEIIDIKLGKTFTFQNVVTEEVYTVYEKLGTYSAQIGYGFWGRIVPYEDAWCYTGTGKTAYPPQAVKKIKEVFRSTDKTTFSQLNFAYIHHTNGQYTGHIRPNNNIHGGKIVSPDYNDAVQAMKEEDFPLALHILAQYANEENELPDIYRWYSNVGVCLFELGETDLAEQYLKHAIDLNPSYKTAKKNLAHFKKKEHIQEYRTLGTLRRYIETLDQYFTLSPDVHIPKDIPLLQNAREFLTYIQDTPISIKGRQSNTLGEHLATLNQRMHMPETLSFDPQARTKIPSKDWPYNLNLLKVLLEERNYIQIQKGKIVPGEYYEEYLQLSDKEQWLSLFYAWTLDIDWADILHISATLGFINNYRNGVLHILQYLSEHKGNNLLSKAAETYIAHTSYYKIKPTEKVLELVINILYPTLMRPMEQLGLVTLTDLPIVEKKEKEKKRFSSQWLRHNMRYTITPLGEDISFTLGLAYDLTIPAVFYHHAKELGMDTK